MEKLSNFPVRIVTAASLYDGHDVSINIMRRVMQDQGAEVIHLGHNRSVYEVVQCAIQEDVHAIAISSYQGGHMEYFTYMYDLLNSLKCGHIRIFGGGGGVILPEEIEKLEAYGIEKIYSPDDGRNLGISGMISDMLSRINQDLDCEGIEGFRPIHQPPESLVKDGGWILGLERDHSIGRWISCIERGEIEPGQLEEELYKSSSMHRPFVLGVTGPGGAGKSSLIDEWVRRFLRMFPGKTLAILAMDPTRRRSGGALLGDRIRMNSIATPRVFMRSMATRERHGTISGSLEPVLDFLRRCSFDLIILETSGIGQSDSIVTDFSDISLYVMTPEYGAPSQLEKIDMLDYADVIALNKADKAGAQDALQWIRKQYRRNHQRWEADDESFPVIACRAAQFNDKGMNRLFLETIRQLDALQPGSFVMREKERLEEGSSQTIIPVERIRYLSEITEGIRQYDQWAREQSALASNWYVLSRTQAILNGTEEPGEGLVSEIKKAEKKLDPENKLKIESWEDTIQRYQSETYNYTVRGRKIDQETNVVSLSGLKIPKIAWPAYRDWGDILHWQLQENFPGFFPFTAGIFPFKRTNEDPTRMFAGEGGPERTNRRFHFVSRGMDARRLSTAFDSVTLYGADPGDRPDIYGKIGNAGVSVCTVDDAVKLYSGFDLTSPKTSVSMTINGPAPAMTAFFFHAAIDQQCEKYIREQGLVEEVKQKIRAKYQGLDMAPPGYHGELPEGNNGLGLLLLGISGREVLPEEIYENIREKTIQKVRGTVQADILKEDQAQNTCIFSTEFSLKVMGDMQEYFIDHSIRNFYSVSISGYHIAEAGANPVTQLAFTLANGFTYVEYYLSRGLSIDDFAPNLSFFFSNGIDPEYSVIGRVARKIWAKAIKYKYGGNERSQKLKYHIQTSGRSLHSQEISYNDIRTTLQALYAIYDNCNSLHTNAYDEAITTPTEESVRRALAIQLIINRELGLAKNQNPLQGSFIIHELTDLVEEAVLYEFDRLTERGGVLGAMETMYQRSAIQAQSYYYEQKKQDGSYPIIGVNTFLNPDSDDSASRSYDGAVMRSTEEEKEHQIRNLRAFQKRNEKDRKQKLDLLKKTALENGNIFKTLMEAVPFCSLEEITNTLFEVGGQYRRGM